METINTYYDNIYCVNLNKRHDKWELCLAEFDKHNITNVERLSAVDGKLTEIVASNKDLWPGEVGCILSHLKILKDIVKNGYERTLVLEDDIEFKEDANTLFSEYIKQVPEDWDLLYLCGNHHNMNTPLTENVHSVKQTYTTSSYSITLEMAKTLIPRLEKMDIQVDVMYSQLQPSHNCYVFRPHIAWQRAGYSDIQDGWHDYPFLKS